MAVHTYILNNTLSSLSFLEYINDHNLHFKISKDLVAAIMDWMATSAYGRKYQKQIQTWPC